MPRMSSSSSTSAACATIDRCMRFLVCSISNLNWAAWRWVEMALSSGGQLGGASVELRPAELASWTWHICSWLPAALHLLYTYVGSGRFSPISEVIVCKKCG